MKAVLEVQNLSYSYPAESNLVLNNINFKVKENEFFSIVGPSGCGKTTLALCLNGLIPKSLSGKLKGKVIIDGKNIKKSDTAHLAEKVQILFQSPESQLFALNVEDEIAFMLTLAIRFVPVITRELNHVINAQKARAHKLKFSLRHPIEMAKSFIPILIPTLMILFKKSLDLSMSIESRAFRAKEKRTYPPRLKFGLGDYLAILVLIVLFVLFLRYK